MTIVLNSGDDDDDQIVESAVLDDVSLSDKSTLFPRSGERVIVGPNKYEKSPVACPMFGRVDARLLAPATKRRKSICFLHPEAIRPVDRPTHKSDGQCRNGADNAGGRVASGEIEKEERCSPRNGNRADEVGDAV